MEHDDAWPCPCHLSLFLISVEGERVSFGRSCSQQLFLLLLPQCWVPSFAAAEPCLVLSALLCTDIAAAHTEQRNVQVKGNAVENGAWEVCGASPALPTSPGWIQAQDMLSKNHSEALWIFFSSLSVSYWDAVKFLSPWVFFPCAALQLSNCSNTRVQFNSISSRAWVFDRFVEDKWKEQLQMGFCAIRALNSLPSWLCVRSYLKEGWVGYEPLKRFKYLNAGSTFCISGCLKLVSECSAVIIFFNIFR